MQIKISVVMSTYNTPIEYLDDSINSILNQTFRDFEFIIVCDGSQQEYNYIKQKYVDERIKLILHKENKGLPYSLNEAIDIASGKYIVRMDSDDISLKDRLKKQYIYMEKNPQIDIAGMWAKCIGESNELIGHFFKKSVEIEMQILYETFLIHPTVVIRKSFLINNSIKYDEEYLCSQDFELWARVANDKNIGMITSVGIFYRIHKAQASQAKKKLQLDLTKKILRRNAKKISPQNEELAYKCLQMLFGLEKIDKANYKEYYSDIEFLIENSENFEKELLRKVIYNRIFIIIKGTILKEEFFKIILNKEIRFKIFNITNLKYTFGAIYRKVCGVIYNYKYKTLRKV